MLQKYCKNITKMLQNGKFCAIIYLYEGNRGDNYGTIKIIIYFIIYNGRINWICSNANKVSRYEC